MAPEKTPVRGTQPRRAGRWAATAIVIAIVIAIACTLLPGRGESSAALLPVQKEKSAETIDHLNPARDSTGAAPSRFEWTPVPGADRYAIGVWDDVGRLVWRQDHLRAPSAARPNEVQLELGTYFWSVSAIRDGRQVAESGMSAFVVVR